ncbi:MAG: HAD-IA family hydrolase [Bacillota bacterium]|nr:HAD-IA family hydrolase [Bacillota bacterium]
MKNIKMIFFDYGNTLVYEKVAHGPKTLAEIYQTIENPKLGLKEFYTSFKEKVRAYQNEYFPKDRDFLYDKVFQEVFEENGLKSALSFEAMVKSYFDTHAQGFAMEGAKELLAYLEEKNLAYGVISNISISENVLSQRLKEVLDRDIDLVISSGDRYYRKPDRKIFTLAADLAGFSLDQCLYIGDNPLCDYKGPKDAGMEAIFFDSPTFSPFVTAREKIFLEEGIIRVNKLLDIIKILEGDINDRR